MSTKGLVVNIILTLAAVVIMDNVFVASVPSVEPAQAIAPRVGSIGVASYYSYECAGLPMANGEPFDPEERTCASWFYEFGTVLKVSSLDTGRTTEVMVTDRGPNKRLVAEGRIIDLSRKAFQDICDPDKGLTRVEITIKA